MSSGNADAMNVVPREQVLFQLWQVMETEATGTPTGPASC